MPSSTRLVILAWGNPSRGDDALGPELARRAQNFAEHCDGAENIEIVEDFQLQVELALDLEDRDLALFIDASASCPPPFAFTILEAARDESFSTHALSPEALLYVHQKVRPGHEIPAFLLAVRGEGFELGQPLGMAAAANLEAAGEFLQQLLRHIEAGVWEGLIMPPGPQQSP